MATNKYCGKPLRIRPAIFGQKYAADTCGCAGINILTAKMPGNSQPAHATAWMSLYDEIRKLEEEALGFAVIVEGIVYGIYSNARESAYIADSLRASGLICEICHYE